MSHIIGDLSEWAQQQVAIDTDAVAKKVAEAVKDIAGLMASKDDDHKDKGLRKFSDDAGKSNNGPVKYLLDHPLGGQRDRVVTSAGLCAEHSDIYVHGENAAIYLPGDAEQHGLADAWKVQTATASYLSNYQYTGAALDTGKLTNFWSIGGLHEAKKEDGEPCQWEIETIELKVPGDKPGDEPLAKLQYIPYQSLLPSFPMAKVMTKEHEKQLKNKGIYKGDPAKSPRDEFKIGDMAPDLVGFYLQWASCDKIVMRMLCDESESPFMLGTGVDLADAAQGVVTKFREWAQKRKMDEVATKLGYTLGADFGFANVAAGLQTPEKVIAALQAAGFPDAGDSYLFQATKSCVHCDADHPLALCNLNCHYQHWIMKSLDIMNGKQYPTMGMIRAYALADDTFRRGARKMQKAGMFYEWPAGPLMRMNAREKGVKMVTDRDAVDQAMATYGIPERIAFLARYVFDVVIDVKLKLRAAAQSAQAKGGRKDGLKMFEAAVQALIKEHQPYLFLFLDYASRMAGKQAQAEALAFGTEADIGGEKLPKDLEGYEAFADPVMGQTLSVTIASGTWVTHTLYRAPHKFKSNARGISDADIQMMLNAADKHGLDKDFAMRLQSRIAQSHDDVFINESILDGMCKHIKGQSIEMYDVQTEQPVPSTMWEWNKVESDGSRRIKLTEAGERKYGKGEDWRSRLVPDCKHLLMVFPDDAMNPQVLPHPPMSGDAVLKFLERAKHATDGNNLFMKVAKRYHNVTPAQVLSLTRDTNARKDHRDWPKSSGDADDRKIVRERGL